jgi:chloramphenicol 3-O-phosphotransferase
MATPWLLTGIDRYLPWLPRRCTEYSHGISPPASDYFLLVYEGEVRRQAGGAVDYSRAGRFVELRIGPAGVRLLAGMYHAVAALALAGLDVIVDDVIHDRRVLQAAVTTLAPVRVYFVGLRLPLAEAERRERERGDRGPGGASAFFDKVHAHGLYDLELDTATHDPLACARQIQQHLQDGPPPHAIQTLARHVDTAGA